MKRTATSFGESSPNARFERNCLAEYAEVFRTVCVDAAYYALPVSQIPRGTWRLRCLGIFSSHSKLRMTITLKQFPNLPRFGAQG